MKYITYVCIRCSWRAPDETKYIRRFDRCGNFLASKPSYFTSVSNGTSNNNNCWLYRWTEMCLYIGIDGVQNEAHLHRTKWFPWRSWWCTNLKCIRSDPSPIHWQHQCLRRTTCMHRFSCRKILNYSHGNSHGFNSYRFSNERCNNSVAHTD